MFKLLSLLNLFIIDHFNPPVFFSVTHKGSLHMQLDSVSFPPQRSHHNELPVPPLLVMSPAAQSRHKHVTIMLTTLLYPTVHLAMRVNERARHWSKWERELCVWPVCVCVREKVVEGVIGGHQASLPPLPKQGCCVIVPGFPVTGLMRTCYCIMFFALIHCNHWFIQCMRPYNIKHWQYTK